MPIIAVLRDGDRGIQEGCCPASLANRRAPCSMRESVSKNKVKKDTGRCLPPTSVPISISTNSLYRDALDAALLK